ncbi:MULTISPECIES: hypothetical protein [unclassified Lysinibacillus]|uniref:hypothetical protein n=1 Tax=unclassified Lysinibacillus TaxID=2636778 RepID=UPI00382DA278
MSTDMVPTGPKHLLNEKKLPADVTDFERNELCLHNSKSGRIVYLRESEAAAANVFCSESIATATNVFCSESEAAATNVFCSESEAAATNVFCSESEAAATITPRRNFIDRILIRKILKLGGEILEIFRLEA